MESRVLKFGGAALRDGPGVERACRIVAERGGRRPVVVVSAHQGVTRLLGELAEQVAAGHDGSAGGQGIRIRHRSLLSQLGLDSELLDRHLRQLAGILRHIEASRSLDQRLRDHVLSFGERMSARVVAAALRRGGLAATPVDAFDLGLVTEGPAPGALGGRELRVADTGGRVRRALEAVPGVPVVTGFLASDPTGNLTTLGPNGSDLTAALVAAAIGAGEVQLWKTVDGMLTADPALVPHARPIERLGYTEAAELAWHGATVLHPAAAQTALRAGIGVRLRNANRPEAAGTLIEPETTAEGPVGIAQRTDVALLELRFDEGALRAGPLAELTARLAARGLEPLLQASGAWGASLVLEDTGALAALAHVPGGTARIVPDLALVALVGRGVGQDARLGGRALEVLDAAGIAPRHVGTGSSGSSRLFLVGAGEVAATVTALHDEFLGRSG